MLASYVSAKHGYVAHFLRLHLCIATLGSVWCDSAVIVVWLGLDPKTTYDCGWKMICLYTLGIKPDICISVLACQALWPQTQLENIKTSHKKSIWVCCHYHGWKLLQLYSKLSGFMNTVRNCPDIWSKLSSSAVTGKAEKCPDIMLNISSGFTLVWQLSCWAITPPSPPPSYDIKVSSYTCNVNVTGLML